MPEIIYFTGGQGRLCARWPGKSVYVPGKGPRKVGQKHLGLVIDQEKNLFWNRKQGYFVFDPLTQSCSAPDPADIPEPDSFQPEGDKPATAPSFIDFGDAFFLDQLIRSIGYDKVIDTIPFDNLDTLYSLIQFRALQGGTATQASAWYRGSYASCLYPDADLTAQGIRDFLQDLGTSENRMEFLLAHIRYALESTDDELCVLLDSVAVPDTCDFPVSFLSNNGSDGNPEYRMITVVQKRTGLPLFYDVFAGSMLDVVALERAIEESGDYGLSVNYVIGDAEYGCPDTVEDLLLRGIRFIARLAPQDMHFQDAVENHLDRLSDPEAAVKFRGRCLRVHRYSKPIVWDPESDEVKFCFVTLCCDEAGLRKAEPLFASSKAAEMTWDELAATSERMGLFAILSSEDLPVEDLLSAYDIHPNIRQYLDSGKNFAAFLPGSSDSFPALNGYLQISFLVTFLDTLIQNRLNALDARYVCAPSKLFSEPPEGAIRIGPEEPGNPDPKTLLLLEQEPRKEIARQSPASLFLSLRGLKAKLSDTIIQLGTAQQDQREYLAAFGLAIPAQVNRLPGNPVPVYKTKPAGNTKVLAFTSPSPLSDEEIQEKRRKKAELESESTAPVKKHRGRKPGSKNRKTLEREAAIARGEIPPPKPKRPYHRKNRPADPPQPDPVD